MTRLTVPHPYIAMVPQWDFLDLLAEAELATIRSRRLLPMMLVQGLQRILHRSVMRPVTAGERNGPPPTMIKLFVRFLRLSYFPARL